MAATVYAADAPPLEEPYPYLTRGVHLWLPQKNTGLFTLSSLLSHYFIVCLF